MKRIIQLIITALLFIISQISCSDDSSTEPESWGGSMNSSGYPEVSGTYLFITDQVTYTCSDGGTGNIPPFSYELQIVQTQGNMIEAVRSDPDPPLPDGFTVFSASDLEGTIQIPDGNSVAFVMNQNIIFNYYEFPVKNHLAPVEAD